MVKEFQAQVNHQFKAMTNTGSYQSKVEAEMDEWHSDFVYYWRIMHEYTLSICPFCDEPYRQQLDLYSLYNWSPRYYGDTLRYSPNGNHTCEHFTAVHGFLNLNRMKPRKRELYGGRLRSTESEVPFISPCLLPDDLESLVVLHSVPICRIEGEMFVPTYTLYLLTYYAQDAAAVLHRRLMEWTGGQPLRHVTWADTRPSLYWEQVQDQPEVWDLERWWRKGKLFWIDPTTQKLNAFNSIEFPYRAIKGVRHGYIYEGGKFTEQTTYWTMQRFQDHLPDLQRAQEESHQRNLQEGNTRKVPHTEPYKYLDTSSKYADFYDLVAKNANGELRIIRHHGDFLPGQPPDLLAIKVREEIPLSALTPESRTHAERIAAVLDGGDMLIYGKSYTYYRDETENPYGKAVLVS
ncbi:MAG: hypothetical protein IPO91_17405 [Chloroflexi bacterium]|nr:hypothetical protein [Chloroflexota bacterium]